MTICPYNHACIVSYFKNLWTMRTKVLILHLLILFEIQYSAKICFCGLCFQKFLSTLTPKIMLRIFMNLVALETIFQLYTLFSLMPE